METPVYAVVQVRNDQPLLFEKVDSNNTKHSKLYTDLEEAQREYLLICEQWYRLVMHELQSNPIPKQWMKEPPMLVELTPRVLSPTRDNTLETIIEAYKQYKRAADTLTTTYKIETEEARKVFKEVLMHTVL